MNAAVLRSLCIGLVLASACAREKPGIRIDDPPVLDAGNAIADAAPDSGPLAPDSGIVCAEDSGIFDPVTLSSLLDYCLAVREGYARLTIGSALSEATACGEPVTELDLEHLRSPRGFLGSTIRPSCAGGELAQSVDLLERSYGLGRMAYDPAALDECRRLGRANASDGGLPFDDAGDLFASCSSILRGVVPVSGACDYHEECASRFCRPSMAASCGGACADPLVAGTACAPRRDICADDGECLAGSNGVFRCVARGEPGDSCGPNPCRRDLTCVSGSCTAPIPAGGPCLVGESACAEGLVCVGADRMGTCRARAQQGEGCGTVPGSGAPPCASRCLTCFAATDTCVPLLSEGEACARGGLPCLPSLVCAADNRCRVKPRRGQACPEGQCLFDDDACVGGVCSEAPPVCMPVQPPPPMKLAEGASCTSDDQCTSGLCDVDRICKVPCSGGCRGDVLDLYGTLIFFALACRFPRRKAITDSAD